MPNTQQTKANRPRANQNQQNTEVENNVEVTDVIEPEVVEINPQLLQAYGQALEQDTQLLRQVGSLSFQLTEVMKQMESMNDQRKDIDVAARDIINRMKDECRLDRNKEWDLDLQSGTFRERLASPQMPPSSE